MIEAKHDSGLMKEYNEKLLYNLIRTKGPISRVDLAKLTGMSPTSVGRVAARFLEEGYTREVGTVNGNVGRKATLLDIIPEGVLAIGVDLNIPHIRVGLVNIQGDITYRCVRDNRPENSVAQVVEIVREAIDEILGGLDSAVKRHIMGIGVSSAGPVNWADGVVLSSPQLNWTHGPVALCDMLSEHFDYEVAVDNDTKSVAQAEQLFGNASDSALIVYLGSGIGSTLILNGRIVRGNNNMAGEIGHMIVEPGGTLCDCGRRGCLQSTACINALENITGRRYAELVQLAKEGDETIAPMMDKTATFLAQWIANVAIAYDPKELILFGDMLNQWPELFELIRERYKQFLWMAGTHKLVLRQSALRHTDIPYLAGASSIFQRFTQPEVSIFG